MTLKQCGRRQKMLKPMKNDNIPDRWVRVGKNEYIVPIKENTTKRKIITYDPDEWLGDEEQFESWRTEEEEKQQNRYNLKQIADIYKMSNKEFQVFIYNELEEIKLSLQSLLEVAKQGGK